MDQYNETNAKYNAQAQGNTSYRYNAGSISQGLGGLAGSAQIGVQTAETLQMLSAENASKLKRVNQQLAILRSRLFGECESKDKEPGGPPAPMPSLGGSLSTANDELLEAFRQLDALVNRV